MKKTTSEQLPIPAEELAKEIPVEAATTKTHKPMGRFTRYCLAVIGCFGASFLLYVVLQLLFGGHALGSLAEAFLCFLVCMGSCGFVYQTKVFKVKPKGFLPIMEFVIAHIFSVAVWQLMINSMITHKYSNWMAYLVPTFNTIVITYFFYKDVVFNTEIKHFSKRLAAAILAAILCIPIGLQSFVSTIYHTLDTDNYVAYVEPTTQLDDFRAESKDGTYEVNSVKDFKYPLTWDDNWFTQDLSVYNPELAHAAAVLSAAAYYECRERISDLDYSSEEFWGKLGFDWINVTSFHYRSESLDKFANLLSGDSNGAAYVVAGKQLVTRDGSSKNLLAISICGSLGFDFADDLLMGRGGYAENGHAGFANAARELATGILEHEGLVTDDTVVFICGHSRGAAVANLLAVELEEMLHWQDSKAKVCSYTFATPNAAGISKVRVTKCDSIFNIINPYDLVTIVPFEEWGFGRYGTDVLLFSPDTIFSEEMMQKIISTAKTMENKNYHFDYSQRKNFNLALTGMNNAVGSDLSNLVRPSNVVRLIRSLIQMQPSRYIYSHSLPMYIAWLSQS